MEMKLGYSKSSILKIHVINRLEAMLDTDKGS